MTISATKLLLRKLDCCCVLGLDHLLLSGEHVPITTTISNSICSVPELWEFSARFRKVFKFPPSLVHITDHARVEGESGGGGGWGGSRMLHLTLEKKNSEIRSPFISPCFLLPQKRQQVSRGCTTRLHQQALTLHPPHFTLAAERWRRWGGWPAAVSRSRPSAPCWGRWSWEQTLWRPWRAGRWPETRAGQTPWGTQPYVMQGSYSIATVQIFKEHFVTTTATWTPYNRSGNQSFLLYLIQSLQICVFFVSFFRFKINPIPHMNVNSKIWRCALKLCKIYFLA